MSSGMKQEHKRMIHKNFEILIERCNTTSLMRNLESKDVFTSDVLQSIREKGNSARDIFTEIVSRGPNAFQNLVIALRESNQRNLADLLDPKLEFMPERKLIGGAYPFKMPDYYIEDISSVMTAVEPQKVNVTPSSDFLHDEPKNNEAPVYFTRSRNRGIAKIINIYNVEGHNVRTSSEKDVNSLNELFKQIGMKVETSLDLTAEEIRKEIKCFVKDDLLKTADITILVIMSHGGITDDNQEYFFGTDGKIVETKFIESQFNNANCVYMHGKPKIIIYQVCRGKNKDYGITHHRTQTDGAPINNIPTTSDLLIVHSTIKDFVAHRDVFLGSWYIQILCYVFMKQCHKIDIETMLKNVQTLMKNHRAYEQTIQIPESINRAFNLCYLNPGIYMENGNICHF